MTESARICIDGHIGSSQACHCGKGTRPYTGEGFGHVCPECGQVFLTQFEEVTHWQDIHGEKKR